VTHSASKLRPILSEEQVGWLTQKLKASRFSIERIEYLERASAEQTAAVLKKAIAETNIGFGNCLEKFAV
jgi:hypothetical protein